MVLQNILLALQIFHVLFLWLHDWVPMGRLNDIQAVKSQDSRKRLIAMTLIQSAPYTLGLFFSIYHYDHPYSNWVRSYLLASYILLFIGELRAWWIPYFWLEEPLRAKRYKVLFGNTHGFLPERHGIRPNSLHILLHLATFATVLMLL
jgi:hypothetical protein